MDTQGKFYLGRIFDTKTGKTSDQPLLYDPSDLTTHALVVGMTGSGKTGLCVDLLEEAALNHIPALMIDPKGDITNTLLHFPDLLPQDFQPWVDPDQARRDGQTLDVAAAKAAESWKKGLTDWGIDADRMRALKASAQFAIFTPGSDAGIPVSILASFAAPEIPWESNREVLREKISSTATAVLGLVGLKDIDPVRSREHILLANILEYAWSRGQGLDLGQLILQTQMPPFQKLGVFDVNTFFPEKDRFELAMLLNNILAAPAFQTWIEGQPLEIGSLLYTPDGRPRHSVFYIAHLSDEERMFFVTLLFSAIESWMRSQSGTSSLRALVYFDEIFGYVPPVANPPSKQPMLSMLKQARAFGIGIVLVTQNPVDLDYKGLSNAGSWFIGKLQADQDKQRLLDGLEGAMAGAIDRSVYDRLISGLGKRVFLLHNVHNKEPLLFQTRWAMNYLVGPLTRTQIPLLNQLAGATLQAAPAQAPAAGQAVPAARPATTAQRKAAPQAAAGVAPIAQAPSRPLTPARPVTGSLQSNILLAHPVLPSGINEYFIPDTVSFSEALRAGQITDTTAAQNLGLLYRPLLLAQAQVRYLDRKYDLDHAQAIAALVTKPDLRGLLPWEDFSAGPFEGADLRGLPNPQARFYAPDASITDSKLISSLEKDFLDWAFRSSEVVLRTNEALDIYAGPDVSQADFRKMCSDKARELRDAEIEKAKQAYERKLSPLQRRLDQEQAELEADKSDLSQRKLEEGGQLISTVASLLLGKSSRGKISASSTKRRQTRRAKVEVEKSEQMVADLQKQISSMETAHTKELDEINQRWSEIANQMDEMRLRPMKKDVVVDLFGIAWAPHHLVQIGDTSKMLPAYR
jgi:hypothetical protein